MHLHALAPLRLVPCTGHIGALAPTYSPPDRRGHEEKRHHHHQRRAVGPGSAVWWFNERMACQVWICLKEMGERDVHAQRAISAEAGWGGDSLPPGHHMSKQICSRERRAPEPGSTPVCSKPPSPHSPDASCGCKSASKSVLAVKPTSLPKHPTPPLNVNSGAASV